MACFDFPNYRAELICIKNKMAGLEQCFRDEFDTEMQSQKDGKIVKRLLKQ